MSERLPLVSVVIPARDEEADIERCIEHVAAQTYPADRLEVIVVDGGSTDATRERATAALERACFAAAAVVDNPASTTPSNLNEGLRRAAGEVLCRVDARTLVEPHYVQTCVEVLRDRPDVAVVGGAQVAVARDGSRTAAGIARALNNRWSMGGSRYRSATASGPSDTVYLGAFRTAQLRAAGGWDERLATNQDFDLNRRMARVGIVWFEASLRSGYVPRAALGDLWRQYVRFGRWKVRYWRLTGDTPRPRQLALAAAVPTTAVVVSVAGGRRRLALLGCGFVGALLLVDARGSDEPAAGSTRVVAAVALSAVGAGWLWGLWRELLRFRPEPRAGTR